MAASLQRAVARRDGFQRVPQVNISPPWRIFERRATRYEEWYDSPRGRRVDRAEWRLLEWLLQPFPVRRTLLEVGSGTGHFTRQLATSATTVVGLDRSPAMIAEARSRTASLPLLIGDAHALPFRARSFDIAAFITTLEFLTDADLALAEAARVAQRGVIVVALNRWSLGGLSRRYGRQRARPLLGQASDYALLGLCSSVKRAVGGRLRRLRWSSTLFPLCPTALAPFPVGDVIGVSAELNLRAHSPSSECSSGFCEN